MVGLGYQLVTTMWDPDGAGPIQPMLVVVGLLSVAGSAVASNIAVYDPISGVWLPLGSGMNTWVTALTTLPNGDLVARRPKLIATECRRRVAARWSP